MYEADWDKVADAHSQRSSTDLSLSFIIRGKGQGGGCLNVRRMRGGTRWSTHSWGIAMDYDPEQNQWKWGRDRATLALPEYDAWWRLWEEEGWTSLGRTKNFDWMHVQAAKP